MSSLLTKPIVPSSGRNKRRIAGKVNGIIPEYLHYPNQAHGKMKRAGILATRKRT